MSPVFPVALTQLEIKALWCRAAATCELPCPEVDGDPALVESFWSGFRKLQDASHRHFQPEHA
jgi:hypothetical protein